MATKQEFIPLLLSGRVEIFNYILIPRIIKITEIRLEKSSMS